MSINTTVAHESLEALDQMVDVAGALGVDAIGLNHLMFSTPEEVAGNESRMIGATDPSVIATFVTPDPGLDIARVKHQVAALAEKCRQHNILFDYRPKVHAPLIENYYTPGAKLEGRCLYPFLHARVGFSGKVYFCPFIRVEVGDLTTSSLEEIWNGPTNVEMRRRLLEHGIFPVCRRCCKVELRAGAGCTAFSGGRRAATCHSFDGRSMTAADMLGRDTLLINPPLVNGVAFTRQGRCQEREDVLGTTKPPYTLALMAALLRREGCRVRLIDATAERLSIDQVIAASMARGFRPSLIIFPSTTPTLDADAAAMAALKRHFGAPMFCFGPHASTTPAESMQRAPEVDGMFVGEPEDAVVALRRPRLARSSVRRSEHDVSRQRRVSRRIVRTANSPVSSRRPSPAWDLLALEHYALPMVNKPYVLVETSRGCPYTCDFCVAPIHQGHKFRERSAKALVDEIERRHRELGLDFFYLWGDTVTLNVKSFTRVLRRADRPQPADSMVRERPRRQPHRSCVRAPPQEGGLLDAGAWYRDRVGRSPQGHDQAARTPEDPDGVQEHAGRGGSSRSPFSSSAIPAKHRTTMAATTNYAIDLDPDFANFYPAVPIRGPRSTRNA